MGKSPFQSADSLPGQFEYRLQVQRVFKDQMHNGIGQEVKLVTPASEALCGVPGLTSTKIYLITGVLDALHSQPRADLDPNLELGDKFVYLGC